ATPASSPFPLWGRGGRGERGFRLAADDGDRMPTTHRAPIPILAALLAAAYLSACAPSQPQAGTKPAPAPTNAPTAAGVPPPAAATSAPAALTHVRIATARTASDAGL